MLSIGRVFRPSFRSLTQVLRQKLEMIILGYNVELNSLENSLTESNVIWKLPHSHKENIWPL